PPGWLRWGLGPSGWLGRGGPARVVAPPGLLALPLFEEAVALRLLERSEELAHLPHQRAKASMTPDRAFEVITSSCQVTAAATPATTAARAAAHRHMLGASTMAANPARKPEGSFPPSSRPSSR